jgi:hypothetical protein
MKRTVCWERTQPFGGTYRFPLQDRKRSQATGGKVRIVSEVHGFTSQNTELFRVMILRTKNPTYNRLIFLCQ